MTARAVSGSVLGWLVLSIVFLARPAVAGDQTQGCIKHNRNLIGILKNNMGKCEKALTKVRAYHKKNLADFNRKKKQTQDYIKGLTEAQKKAFGKRIAKKLMNLMGEMLKVSARFGKKCPKQSEKMRPIFSDFSLQ
jgi:hypothetical protein